jgi:hypothetical protein
MASAFNNPKAFPANDIGTITELYKHHFLIASKANGVISIKREVFIIRRSDMGNLETWVIRYWLLVID